MRLLLAILYGIAVVLVPLAHRMSPPSTAAKGAALDLTAYALPDGTLPILCVSGADGTGKSAVKPVCEACTLTAAAGLLPPSAAELVPCDRREDRATVRPTVRPTVHIARNTARPRDPPRATV